MPQQNRVDPWGVLHAVPQHGTRMGNRGILHDDDGAIVRRWANKTWVTCVLDFKQRTSPGIFRPGHYSKLFFFDEATAFAAGHRPCAECQRGRYREFKARWAEANGFAEKVTAREMDHVLHTERVGPHRSVSDAVPLSLPPGTMYEQDGAAILVGHDDRRWKWSFDGYEPVETTGPEPMRLLTPSSVVRTFAQGFVPRDLPA